MIRRFTATNISNAVTNITQFHDFLVEYKSSTFLKDMEISAVTTTSPPQITITSKNGTTTLKILCRPEGGGSDTVFSYHANENFTSNSTTYGSGTAYWSSAFIKGAILCDKGIILHIYGMAYASSSAAESYNSLGYALTVDDNDELSVIATNNYIPVNADYVTTSNTIGIMHPLSTAKGSFRIQTQYGASQTCLSPLIPCNTSDPDARLPFAYGATQTQYPAERLGAVRLGGVDYITNGTWYIRDTPIE
jgi:hypothetical protein